MVYIHKPLKARASLLGLAIALTSLAQAGHYTAEPVVWDGGTASHTSDATASLAGRTATWSDSLGYGVGPKGEEHKTFYSSVLGNVKWQVTWHRDSPSDVAPSSANILVAKYGHISASSEASADGSLNGGGSASAQVLSSNFGLGGITSAHIDAYSGGDVVDRYGTSTDAHHGYYTFSGSSAAPFTSESSGVCYAYVVVSLNSSAQISVDSDGDGDEDSGNFIAHADILGKLRLVTVNGTQVANDFPGGSYATTGFGD